MREKKSPSSSSYEAQAQASQSVKESESIFMGFYCPFFPSTKQSSLMEIIFSRVGFTVQLTATIRACPIAMKNVQINISSNTKKTLNSELNTKYGDDAFKENITN